MTYYLLFSNKWLASWHQRVNNSKGKSYKLQIYKSDITLHNS